MTTVNSYGIIPVRKTINGWDLLVIHSKQGFWGFPKGHPEEGESHFETASRELIEETALSITKLLVEMPLHEAYTFLHEGKKVDKIVTYYVAEVEGEVVLQEAEVTASKWVDIADAEGYLTFPEARELCRKVRALLQEV